MACSPDGKNARAVLNKITRSLLLQRDRETTENSWYQMPVYLGAVFRVARQVLREKGFLIEQPPDQAGSHESTGDKPPISSEPQSQSHEIQYRARIHGIADDRVGTGGNHSLVLGNFDSCRAERILLEYSIYHHHANEDQEVAHNGKPYRHIRPAEAVIEPGNNVCGDARNGGAPQYDLLNSPCLCCRPELCPTLEK